MSGLAPFEQHGVVEIQKTSASEAVGSCPWCGKKKFFIHIDRQVWDCKVCAKSGNLSGFFREVVIRNAKVATKESLLALSQDRGGISAETLKAWRIGWNGRQFTYPAYNLNGKGSPEVSDVRRYKPGGKPFSTSGGHIGLMMSSESAKSANGKPGTVWICEGEWDGMAWHEVLQGADGENEVVAVPGAGNFPVKHLARFRGKDVVLLFDNDPPGQAGQAKTWGKLQGIAKSLRRIKWPEGLPEGFDIRDLWMELDRDPERVKARVEELLIKDPPPGTAGAAGSAVVAAVEAKDQIDPEGKGLHPDIVRKRFAEWLDLHCPEALDVIFGSVFANRIDIDPLWIFIVAPSGGCKSELIMPLGAAPLVHCITSITPHTLISGMNFGGADPSLIPRIIGKTLVVKDFTTILSLNQMARDEIFGVLRDAYDGKISKGFGNNVTRNYEGRFGIVGGVTPVIDSAMAQNAVLGERFIKFRISHEGKVITGKAAIMRALDNLTNESEMREKLGQVAREVLNRPIEREHYPKIPKWFKERVIELAQWVAVMRGAVVRERYTGSTGVIASKPSAEIATRLAKQLCTLAIGIGIYRMIDELDEEVYRIITKVGRDTCPDRAEEIIRRLYAVGGSATIKDLIETTHFPYDTIRWVLQDLELLGVVRKRKGRDGVYEIVESISTILKRLKIYDMDRAWKRATEEEG